MPTARTFKIGRDDPDRQKSRIDRVMVRGGAVTSFFEIKRCNYSFRDERLPRGWGVGEKKIIAARALFEVVRVPVLLIVQFADELAALNTNESYAIENRFGRIDRDDRADIERGAIFQWEQFRLVGPRAA